GVPRAEQRNPGGDRGVVGHVDSLGANRLGDFTPRRVRPPGPYEGAPSADLAAQQPTGRGWSVVNSASTKGATSVDTPTTTRICPMCRGRKVTGKLVKEGRRW